MTSAAPVSPTSTPAKTAPQKPGAFKRLRIWPAILFLAILGAAKIAPAFLPDDSQVLFAIVMLGPLVAMLGILLWWLLASRAKFIERLVGLLGMIIAGAATMMLADVSMRNFVPISMYALPAGIAAFALAAVVLYAMPPRVRTMGVVIGSLIGFGCWDFVRFEGLWGDFHSSLVWRWKPDAEEEYLKQLASRSSNEKSSAALPKSEQQPLVALWPSFRGPNRDGVVAGIELKTTWKTDPPRQIWRVPVGPSWSSFAVATDRLFTQEQRGESEAVVCLDANTGAELWNHSYSSRFFESIGGAGPRATPTIAGDRLYSLGATGMLHCLDLWSGSVIWKKDLKQVAKRQPPIWGFASSPLVTEGVVIVHAGGSGNKGVLAFDAEDGELRWSVPAGDHSYSSPQLAQLNNEPVVLMLTNTELAAIDARRGKVVWNYKADFGGRGMLQPLVASSSVILGAGTEIGARRIDVSFDQSRAKITQRWESRDMKSDFNDFVAHDGYLYGFDGKIFACIDLEHGKRQWKKGRYGKGQVLLLSDSNQLLVLSETGDLVVVSADPKKFLELARCKVLDGKTWNHPVVVGNRLYARNGEEAVCFELPTMSEGATAPVAVVRER